MRRLWARTIWAKGAIPPDHIVDQALKRAALPVYDLIAILAGIYAVRSGIPAIDTILPEDIGDMFGWMFVGVAFVCLVGVSFPRLYLLEIVAKCLLFAFLGVYAGALRIVGLDTGLTTRDFISAVVVMAMVLPVLRLWILGREWGIRNRPVQMPEVVGA